MSASTTFNVLRGSSETWIAWSELGQNWTIGSNNPNFQWLTTNDPLNWPNNSCQVPQPFTFGNPSPYTINPTVCGPNLNLAAAPADGQNLTNGPNWLSDPVVVADKLGHVFSLNIATATAPSPCGNLGQPACCGQMGQPACGLDRIAVAISTDSGTSFQKYQIVDDGSCSNGTQDQPSATVDLTTNPPTLWVVWRHQNIFPFGGCIRGGQFFDADGRIWWNAGDGLPHDTDAQGISNMIEESTGVGQGGLFVQAGDGVVSVVYHDAGDYGTATPCCPADGVKGVGWGIVSTPTNNLTDWSLDFDPTLLGSILFFHTDTYEYCPVNGNQPPGSDTGTISAGWKNFSFVRDPTRGYYYVAVNDSKNSIRILRSTSLGVYWDELCGDTGEWFSQVSLAGGKCTVPAIGGLPTDPPSLFFPALAVDPNGWLAIVNYQSDPTDTQVQEVFRARTMTGNVEGPWQPAGLHGAPTTLTNFFFVPQSPPGPACGSSRTLGDYQYMAAETHAFLVGQPLCPAAVNFEPAWTGINPASGGVTVQTAHVSVSP